MHGWFFAKLWFDQLAAASRPNTFHCLSTSGKEWVSLNYDREMLHINVCQTFFWEGGGWNQMKQVMLETNYKLIKQSIREMAKKLSLWVRELLMPKAIQIYFGVSHQAHALVCVCVCVCVCECVKNDQASSKTRNLDSCFSLVGPHQQGPELC